MLREIERVRPAPAEILDAGAGDGSLCVLLGWRGYRVAAVDVAVSCLERLTARWERKDRPPPSQLICAIARLSSLPFPEASFDLVVSGEVLEHLPDDAAAVREFFRVLRPGGAAVVTVPADPRLWDIEDEWAGHKRRYDKEDLGKLFTEAGFVLLVLDYWGWPVTYFYNRYLFRYWLKRRIRDGDPNLNQTRPAGINPCLARLMAAVFSVDRLFLRLPKGIGLLGVFRKPG